MENLIQIKNWIYQIDPIWWKSLGILALVVIVLKVLIFFRFYGKFFVRGRGMLEEHIEKRGEICGRVISAGIWGFIIADLDYVYDAIVRGNLERSSKEFSPQYAQVGGRYYLSSSFFIRRFLIVREILRTKIGRFFWALMLMCQLKWNKNSAKFITRDIPCKLCEYNLRGLREHVVFAAKISWWRYFLLQKYDVPLYVEYADGVVSRKIREEAKPIAIWLNRSLAVNIEFLVGERNESYCPEGYAEMDVHLAKTLLRKATLFSSTLCALKLHSFNNSFVALGDDMYLHFPYGFLRQNEDSRWLLDSVRSYYKLYVKCRNRLLA